MTELLKEMETALADLMQSGLSTIRDGKRFEALAASCEAYGLHVGSRLMGEIGKMLDARVHTMEKEDLPLAETIFRTIRYVTLCREKCQEEAILHRWQEEGGTL